MNLSGPFKAAKSFMTANSPVLLAGAAIAGVVTTGVLAAQAGYKARGIIDFHTDGEPEKIDFKKKAELTWLCFAAPAVAGVSTIASIAGMHLIHNKRQAALAAMYAMTSTKLDDYREQAETLLGPKKSQQISDQLAQNAVDANSPSTYLGTHEIQMLPGGTEMCYDEWAGRWFHGSVNAIRAAENEVNAQMAEAGDACLNDFYEHLGLSPTQMGQEYGWSGRKGINVIIGAAKVDEKPVLTMSFRQEPKANLGRSS